MGWFVVEESLSVTVGFAVASGFFITFATATTHYPAYLDRMVAAMNPAEEHPEESFLDNASVEQTTKWKRTEKVSKKWWTVVRQLIYFSLLYAFSVSSF